MGSRQFVPWDIKTMPLSKSALQTYEQCRNRFKRQVIDGAHEERGEQLIKGSLWHEHLYNLYGKVDRQAVISVRKVDDEYRKYLPNDPITDNFIEVENQRLEEFMKLGKHEYFWPVLLEQFYHDPKYNYFGTLDRLDKSPNGNFIVIDYKTGKFHPYNISKYRRELAGYKHLIETVTNMKVSTGCIFFLEEVKENRVMCEEIKDITMRAFHASIKRIRDRIREGHFEKNVGVLCDYCPFGIDCLSEDDALTGQVTTNGT